MAKAKKEPSAAFNQGFEEVFYMLDADVVFNEHKIANLQEAAKLDRSLVTEVDRYKGRLEAYVKARRALSNPTLKIQEGRA